MEGSGGRTRWQRQWLLDTMLGIEKFSIFFFFEGEAYAFYFVQMNKLPNRKSGMWVWKSRGQAGGLDLRLLYKTWLDPWWWLGTEPWVCLCWEGGWRQGDGGKTRVHLNQRKEKWQPHVGAGQALSPAVSLRQPWRTSSWVWSLSSTSEVITQPPTQRCLVVVSGSGKMLVCKTVYL